MLEGELVLGLLRDVAAAMRFLHAGARPIVHGLPRLAMRTQCVWPPTSLRWRAASSACRTCRLNLSNKLRIIFRVTVGPKGFAATLRESAL
jgi:hypothetical protein